MSAHAAAQVQQSDRRRDQISASRHGLGEEIGEVVLHAEATLIKARSTFISLTQGTRLERASVSITRIRLPQRHASENILISTRLLLVELPRARAQ